MTTAFTPKGFKVGDRVRIVKPEVFDGGVGTPHPWIKLAGGVAARGRDLWYWDLPDQAVGEVVVIVRPGDYSMASSGIWFVDTPSRMTPKSVCEEFLEFATPPAPVTPKVCTCDVWVRGCTCGVFAAERAAASAAEA